MSVRPLSPNGKLSTRSSSLRLFQTKSVTLAFAFAILSLFLNIASASAQTRPLRVNDESEERLRRVEEENKAGVNESGKPDNAKQAVVPQPSHVRKTALTYTPRVGNPNATSAPALTNDLVIISRASESPRRLSASKSASANIPSIWPVVGTLRSGVGMRSNPFGGSSVEFHKGQDISAPSGTPVIATADGVIVIARWMKGYGKGIYIDHGNGISTRYGHLSRIDVVEGQPIRRGEQLGLVGSTGRSTGPHLHYEVRVNGQPTSPLLYLPAVAPLPPPPPSSEAQSGISN